MELSFNIVSELKDSNALDESMYENIPAAINQIGDSHWYMEIQTPAKGKIISWDSMLKTNNLPGSFLRIIQESYLVYIGDYTNVVNGRIVLRSTSQIDKANRFARFFSLFFKKTSSVNEWCKLSIDELKAVLIEDLKQARAEVGLGDKKNQTKGYGRTTGFAAILRFYSDKGSMISPFSSYELSYLPGNDKLYEEYLESEGLTWGQFSTSTHHNLIPFHIALPWVNYIVQYFKSDDFNYWRVYWHWVREQERIAVNSTTASFTRFFTHIKSSRKYLKGESKGNKPYFAFNSDNILKSLTYFFIEENSLEGLYLWAKKRYDNPKVGFNDMLTNTSVQLGHLYALIVMTNGPRRSEIADLRLGDFKVETDDVSGYRSYIHKTNDGLPTIRQISGVVHDVANNICDIGRIDRSLNGVRLFHLKNGNSQDGLDSDFVATFFDRSYQSFLQSLPEGLAEEMRLELPNVTPHQGRHLFAAFALRVSDGNIFEEIRRHFRHAYKSFMTNEYTEYKLSDLEKNFVEREFIAEILNNIVTKKDHGYFGPMLSTLEEIIDSKFSFSSLESTEEIREMCNELSGLVDTIRVHEWGFCVPLKATLAKSQCWDNSTKIPLLDEGSSFKNCSGCLHLLSNEACIEDIQRIAIGLSQTLDNFPILSNKLRGSLESEFKRAVALINKVPGG